MPDYNQLRDLCQQDTDISRSLIDEFLLYYAAVQDKIDQQFESRISRFRETEREMPGNWKELVKAQYIAHRIFKQGGLIKKYSNHAAIKERTPREQNYLRKLAAHPWRFSFAEVSANPAPDFYEMEDVFSGDVYLLYSRSMTKTLSEHPVLLWFNLIGYNGSCWQSYGPVISFKSFSPDDIFFYATELNQAIESEADLAEDLEENPIPYMLLTTGSNYPLFQSRGHEVVQVFGEDFSANFDMPKLKAEFKIEYAEPVFKLTHAVWSEPPHYSEAYYAEDKGVVALTALTDQGYEEMARLLKQYGLDIPADPDIRIHLPILTTMETLFKKRPELHPYAALFETQKSPETNAMLAKLNQFLALAMPYMNSGADPDIDKLAKQAGLDPETAREAYQQTVKKIREMQKKR
jgi:hypothetical protein